MGVLDWMFKKKVNAEIILPAGSHPLLNEPMGIVASPYGLNPIVDKATLWVYVRGSAEVQAIISAMVEDIVSDGYYLDGGRNGKKQADSFLKKNHFKEALIETLWDAFVTGDGYIWHDGVTKSKIKGAIDKAVESKPELKSRIGETIKAKLSEDVFASLKSEDEDVFSTRNFMSVASSTIKIRFENDGGVPVEYVQLVGAKFAKFNPENILHFRPWKVDGKMYGFTPMHSIMRELDILTNVKDLARYYFEKGGVPNFMFLLEDETPDSQNYKVLTKTLSLYSNLSNKFKNLVLTGKVEVKDLNRVNKDMEFRELAKYVTQVLIMAWGIPLSRISDGLSEAGLKGSTSSNEGYFRKISHIQSLVEDIINEQLLYDFEVKLRFNRNYLQDELRETQRDKQKTDIVEQRMRLGLISWEAACEELQIPEDKRGDKKLAESGMLNQGLQQNRNTMKPTEKLADDKNKRTIALEKK